MADKVCLEVKRLGTQAAITSVVLTAERRNTVDYVISRGNIELSTRDYLNENTRYSSNTSLCPIFSLHVDTSISIEDQRQKIVKAFPAPPSLMKRAGE